MKLAAEAGCVDLLKWRCDLDPALDFEALTLDLRRHGLRARVFEPALIVLDAAPGDEIVIVPRTGRVQIRVHLLTPRPQRPGVARRLLALLDQAVAACPRGAAAAAPGRTCAPEPGPTARGE